jgi:hypothetical protein
MLGTLRPLCGLQRFMPRFLPSQVVRSRVFFTANEPHVNTKRSLTCCSSSCLCCSAVRLSPTVAMRTFHLLYRTTIVSHLRCPSRGQKMAFPGEKNYSMSSFESLNGLFFWINLRANKEASPSSFRGSVDANGP